MIPALWLYIIVLCLCIGALVVSIGSLSKRLWRLERAWEYQKQINDQIAETVQLLRKHQDAMSDYDRELYERITLLTREFYRRQP